MKTRVLGAVVALAAMAASPLAAAAAQKPPAAAPASAPAGEHSSRAPQPPTTLPRPAKGARALESGAPWIVAARPGAATAAIAAGASVAPLAPEIGLYTAPEGAAAGFVSRLRAAGLFLYAEPDVPTRTDALPADPLTPQQWWIGQLINPLLVPPAVSPTPTLGIVEAGVDTTHPDLNGGNVTTAGPIVAADLHGTAVTSVASAPANGVGIVGLWPGAQTRVYGSQGNCAGGAAAVTAAAIDRVKVINMSYGVDVSCFSHYLATQFAFGLGSVLVAAAGNDFALGSPARSPAVDPHVLTVGAVGSDLSPAPFTNAGDGLDLAGPGVAVPAAVPVSQDTDGTPDGYQSLDGTSFASPIVAAAAAWLRVVRPELTAPQTNALLNRTARDLGATGWDNRTGWGLVDLGAALTASAPFNDPGEPNDDIEWIDGRHFRKDPALLRTRRAFTFPATLDFIEDPEDVVAVWMPRGTRLRVDAVPVGRDDVSLEVFSRKARTVFSRTRPKSLEAWSFHAGPRRETVFVTNRGPAQVVYVETFVPRTARFSNAVYRLILNRAKLPAGAPCGPVASNRGCLP